MSSYLILKHVEWEKNAIFDMCIWRTSVYYKSRILIQDSHKLILDFTDRSIQGNGVN